MVTGEYKITNIDGDETTFHIIKGEIIPYSNFKVAQQWYSANILIPKSKANMEEILKHRK